MRWTAADLVLRPILFGLAIAGAVIAGEWTHSVWYGLLGFVVAARFGRALRTNVAARAVWPVAATGFAFLYDRLGLATWATFFAAWACASVTRWVLR
jgi:hypothetical protein